MTSNDTAEATRVGETIRALREARGLTLDELANAVGISRPYLNNIERGERRLTPVLAARVAHALDVRQAALVRPDLYGEAA
jgi:transcriptional regulator with XRE-family HTH domain